MEETLQKEMAQALRSKSPLSVVMMDVDLFKQINDGNGHHVGDAILQGLANMLMDNIRLGDTACRYGGDELVVVMPGAAEANAFPANLWREKFSSMDFIVNDVRVRTTLSLGVASMSHGFRRFEDLLIAADKALYVSKINRNAVNRFTPKTKKKNNLLWQIDHKDRAPSNFTGRLNAPAVCVDDLFGDGKSKPAVLTVGA